MAHANREGLPEPRPARIVPSHRGKELRTPKHGKLVGVIDDKGQLVIKRGEELVIVEVPKSE